MPSTRKAKNTNLPKDNGVDEVKFEEAINAPTNTETDEANSEVSESGDNDLGLYEFSDEQIKSLINSIFESIEKADTPVEISKRSYQIVLSIAIQLLNKVGMIQTFAQIFSDIVEEANRNSANE